MSYNFSTDNTTKKKLSIFKLASILLILFLFGFGIKLYGDYKYKNMLTEFYTNFNKCDFQAANTVVTNNKNLISLYNNSFNSDLTNYFNGIVNTLLESPSNSASSINSNLAILKEMKKYPVLQNPIDKLITYYDNKSKGFTSNTTDTSQTTSTTIDTSNVSDTLSQGINYFNKKDYINAYNSFLTVTNNSPDYSTAQAYIEKCSTAYKDELLSSVDELVFNKYYTKALNLLTSYDTRLISSTDKDISDKNSSIKAFKEEYLSDSTTDDSITTSSSLLNAITTSNINTLNIESKTAYLVYLNLAEQKTYVYTGSKDNWTLAKTFLSATGLPSEDTPTGVFTISDRGNWFFSSDYQQGAKYWVKFMGDYLFHSVPYAEDQATIVDNTLGKPASHGCVRLATDDAKWLYDNVTTNTKVIIN